jgi:hypothetical protein
MAADEIDSMAEDMTSRRLLCVRLAGCVGGGGSRAAAAQCEVEAADEYMEE